MRTACPHKELYELQEMEKRIIFGKSIPFVRSSICMSVYLQGGKKHFKELSINSTMTRDCSCKGLKFSVMEKKKKIQGNLPSHLFFQIQTQSPHLYIFICSLIKN